MDFIPFGSHVFTPTSLITTGAVFLVVGMLALAAAVFGIFVFPKEKLAKGQPVSKAVFSIGAVGLASVFISIPLSFIETRESIIAVAEHRQTVADGFAEHYGVNVTVEDVKELNYPTREPEEEKVVGAATLDSGMRVTLIVEDGKARLYRLNEELPVAD